jgi:hypothetical protein
MKPRGSLLLETILATGLAAIYGLALTQLVLTTNSASLRIEDRLEASYAASQGVEALNSIGFSDLSNILNGHLVFSSGVWSTAAGTETLPNGMIRSVTVQSVNRDVTCAVVNLGGTTDSDSKKISSSVSWVDQAGVSQSVTYSKHRTHYEDPQGSCFSDASSHVSLDTGTDKWTAAGNRQLHQLYIENTGADTIVIDKIAFTWTNAANINRIVLDATQVWALPAGQPSGTLLDVTNFSIASGQTFEFTNVSFSNNMTGTTLTLSITFTDGSIYVSPAFTPN